MYALILYTILSLAVSGLIAFLLDRYAQVPQAIGIPFATLIFAALLFIWDQTEGFTKSPRSPKISKEHIKSFSEYTFTVPTAFAMTLSIYVAISFVASIFSGAIWWYLGGDYSRLYISTWKIAIIPPEVVVVELLLLFFLGYWVGVKAKHYPYFVSMLGVGALTFVYLIFGTVREMPDKLTELVHHEVTPAAFVLSTLVFMGLALAVVFFGATKGRRNQHAFYIKYLFRKREEDLKLEIAESIYERFKEQPE